MLRPFVPVTEQRSADAPIELFKYLRRDHALAMVRRGQVQLGTLHGFRDVERYGAAIGDADEGHLTSTYRNVETDMAKPETINWALSKVFSAPPGGTNTTIVGGEFIIHEEMPDCLVYCLSRDLDRTAMEGTEYDTVVRIHDVSGFSRALFRALQADAPSCQRVVGSMVNYEGRARDATLPRLHPAFVKAPRYASQREYRFIFQTDPSEVRVRRVQTLQIASCCELVTLP